MLEWIALDNGVTSLAHYLDNYITMDPPKSPICYHNQQLLSELRTMLGVPLAHNKVEGPSTT